MPELPEVETVVRDLRPLLVGRTIRAVHKSRRKLRRPWRSAWDAMIRNARVEGIRRRGKWILVDLNGSPVLRVHLGMTGQFTVTGATESAPDHLHLRFVLDTGVELRFRDPRRFGSAEWFADREALAADMDHQLGPEPIGLDADYFRSALRATRRALKAVLLDQSVVAGVGNIYADEALFHAGIHPGRRGNSLSNAECDRLRVGIETVLMKAIEFRGSTIRDYVGGSGLRGGFQKEFAVYGQTSKCCQRCHATIRCVRLAGRSSHYCPECQRLSSPAMRHRKSSAETER